MDEAKRKAFLGRLSQSLGRTEVPASVEPFDYSKGPQGKIFQDLSREEVLNMFKAECERNGTKYVTTTAADLGKTLLEVVESWGNGKVVYPKSEEMQQYNLLETFKNDNNEARTFVEWDAEKGREYCIELAQDAEMGITFPIYGIAETATVIQPSCEESGRSIGLLPLVHIAVIKTSTILPRMTQTMEKLTDIYRSAPDTFPTNIVHISGPSNTADIELIRVVGVHGPINVTYVLVDDEH